MSNALTPVWRIGVIAVMGLNLVVDIMVSLNDERVRSWVMQRRSWIFVAGAAWLVGWFACTGVAFGRHDRLLWLCLSMFVLGLVGANGLMLATAFEAAQPPPVDFYDLTASVGATTVHDASRERWCAVAGGTFDILVFVTSWRPRGAVSGVKLPLSAAPPHVRPVMGEIIFNIALVSLLWGSVVIVRNDSAWDWCYMRDWIGSVFTQAYLCLYATCNGGLPAGWTIAQRLAAVFMWPVMGFIF